MTNTIRWPDVAKPQVLGVSGDMRLIASKEPDGVTIRNLDSGKPVKELAQLLRLFRCDGAQRRRNANPGPARNPGEQQGAGVDVSLWKIEDPKPVTLKLPADARLRIQDFSSAAMVALSGNDTRRACDRSARRQRQAAQACRAAAQERDGGAAVARRQARFGARRFRKARRQAGGRGREHAQFCIDTADGKIRQRFETAEDAHRHRLRLLARRLAIRARACAMARAEIWDTAHRQRRSSRCRRQRKTPTPARSRSRRTAAGLIGAGMFDDDVFVWNIETGKIQRIYKMPNGLAGYRYATSVAASRDRKMVAAGLGQRATSSGDIGAERGGILRVGRRYRKIAHHASQPARRDHGADLLRQRQMDRLGQPRRHHPVLGSQHRQAARNRGRGSERTLDRDDGGRGLCRLRRQRRRGQCGARHLAPHRARRSRKSSPRPDLVEMLFKGDTAKYQDAVKKLDLPSVAP